MFDFKLATTYATPAAFTWDAFNSHSVAEGVIFLCNAPQQDADLLPQTIMLLSQWLHKHASHMTDKQVSQVMRYIADLDERKEEAELAANPARRAGIEQAAQRLAQRTEYEIANLFELA
ncbi:MAG: hypothetical protein EOO60_04560 [Hymenobacter sp.]|nr:MAG: hypothetical protein EOO60_04560 [Hymenobacter sp.]